MVYLAAHNFEEEILEHDKNCLVKFSNDECPLCSGLDRVYDSLHTLYGASIKFATVDVEANSELADLFEIDGVPTVYFFTDGNAEEVPYPENPSIVSGYGEQYLINYINNRLGRDN